MQLVSGRKARLEESAFPLHLFPMTIYVERRRWERLVLENRDQEPAFLNQLYW
jgi:hypothetical protein